MSEAKGNAKAHEATTNSIINLDEFTSYASRQKQTVSEIPEFDRITLTTTDDMREALETIKAQAYFDWTKSHGVRFGELEIDVESLEGEEQFLVKRVKEDETLVRKTPRMISANALRLKMRENTDGQQ